MIDSEVEKLTADLQARFKPSEIRPKMAFSQSDIRALIEYAVNSALENQAKKFEEKLKEVENKFRQVSVSAPEVEVFTDAEIIPGIGCDETLDIVKSLPDFEGKIETYVSWRKAAHTAYKIFENYVGSSKHYQALGIIRNKIKSPADMVLSSYDTPLHFKAIIKRLDFTYKRPIYLIEQELSILRQGNLTIIQYYEEIEKKLTLLINKTIMTYDSTIAASLNEKYRADALRVFISGTKKALSDILFSARPRDLPSALALAQEVESNHERFQFANNFAKNVEEKAHRNEQRQQRHLPSENNNSQPGKNPFFKQKIQNNNQNVTQEPPQPMDIDSSSRFRQRTQNSNTTYPSYPNQASKRANSGTARYTGSKQQRVNHISQAENFENQEEQEYQTIVESEVTDIDDQNQLQEVNFLEVENIEVPLEIDKKFKKMLKERISVFADPNEVLPHNPNIIATIRTEDENPIYSNYTDRRDRTFQVGDKVFPKLNKRLGNKLTPLFEEVTVEADLGSTVLIRGREVHKDNLR